jgi:hypothetical protein
MRSSTLLRRREEKQDLTNFLLAFQEALIDTGPSDLGYTGDKFTWHRGGIRERLDRAVACDGWRSKFPDATVENLDYSRSDHQPVLLKFGEEQVT